MKNIFISSTFRDMQAERDLIQERVLPALREEAKKYGDNVGVIDLRWGVDTSTLETDEGSAKVLKVCLDEIDRSHPYMLIFLGERYGWIPNGELIERAVRERGDKYVTDDFEKSVTALEIEYGALSELYGDLDRCIVCFREPIYGEMDEENKSIYQEQNEIGKQKLEALKARIRTELGEESRLISYTCEWDESAQVLKEFMADGLPLEEVLVKRYIELFEKDWEEYKNLSWQEKEQLVFKALMESKLRTFVGREALLEECYQMMVSKDKPIILRGEVGSGKTALMSKLIDCMQKEGKNVFSFFCGMGSMSKHADELVQQIIYFVEAQLGVEHADDLFEIGKESIIESEELWMSGKEIQKKFKYEQNMEYLRELCAKLHEHVFVCIDALDQLSDDEHVEKLDFLFSTKKVQMVASCTDTFELSSAVKIRTELIDIPMLTVEDAKLVAKGILHADSRDYFDELEKALVTKRSIGSPLYISFLIQRLNMMGQEELAQVNTAEAIVSYGAKVIVDIPDDLENAAVAILKDAIHKISDETDGLLLDVVRFLAVSRTGLKMDDLREIFKLRGEEFPTLDMTLLIKYQDAFFYIGEDDRINFTHKIIRKGLLDTIEDDRIYKNEIKNYIKSLKKTESLWEEEAMYYARITEDYDFAIQIFERMFWNGSEKLKKAIVEEMLSEEGVFFGELLKRDPEDIQTTKQILQSLIISDFGISQKEQRVRMMLSLAILNYAREIYKRDKKLLNLRDLALGCINAGEAFLHIGKPEKALEYYEEGLSLSVELYNELEDIQSLRLIGINYDRVGHALLDLGKMNEALDYYKKGLKYAEKLNKKVGNLSSLKSVCIGYINIADILMRLDKPEEALVFYKKALEQYEEIQDFTEEIGGLGKVSICCVKIGSALRKMKNVKDAFSYIERGVKGLEEVNRKQADLSSLAKLSTAYGYLGEVLSDMDLLEEAVGYYQKAREYAEMLHENQKSVSSLKTLIVKYHNTGEALIKVKQTKEGLRYLEKSVKCAEDVHKEQQNISSAREARQCCIDIGKTLCILGEWKMAAIYLKKRVKYAKWLYENQNTMENLKELRDSYDVLGYILNDLGMQEETIRCYEEAIAYEEELYAMQPTEERLRGIFTSFNTLGRLLRNLGNRKEAVGYYKKALNYMEKAYTIQPSIKAAEKIFEAAVPIGQILCDLGSIQEALKYYEKADIMLNRIYESGQSGIGLEDILTYYFEVAKSLCDLGVSDESIRYYDKALSYEEELYQIQQSVQRLKRLSDHYREVGSGLRKLGKLEDALKYYRKAIEWKKHLNQIQSNSANLKVLFYTYFNIGNVYKEMQQVEMALSYYEQGLQGITSLYENYNSEDTFNALSEAYRHYIKSLKEIISFLLALDKIEEVQRHKAKAIKLAEQLYEHTGEDSDKNLLDEVKNLG